MIATVRSRYLTSILQPPGSPSYAVDLLTTGRLLTTYAWNSRL